MPEYTQPMCGVSSAIFCTVSSSMRALGSFFSVAMTTPFFALMPSEVAPAPTAFSAYSICTSLPLGLKVVSEKLDSDIAGEAAAKGVQPAEQGRRRSGDAWLA